MKNLTAEYNRYGYTIFCNDEPIYGAGNSPFESAVVVLPRHGLPLETIKQFAQQTMSEFAKELQGVCGECVRVNYRQQPECLGGR